MRLRIRALALACLLLVAARTARAEGPPVRRDYAFPLLDLAAEAGRQTVVDREPGQYLGHPTTALLEDGKTLFAAYPKGHGKGAIILKKSTDGGLSWSDRLPVPANWATSRETPTIHRVIDPEGRRRLILFSGLYPIRMASSEDDGRTWTPLEAIGDFGGIVAMASVEQLKDGSLMALFHDDGRYLRGEGKPSRFRVFKVLSRDGGRTWGQPEVIADHPDADLCEPGLVRSPDGTQIAVLLRENRRKHNSFVIFSDDEGKSWTAPRELPGALTGDRHVAKYAPDGRLLVSFRDTAQKSPTRGDWVAWVGTYEDIATGREGQYRVRLMDNRKAMDCAYPGVEVRPDGTFVLTTYGHWAEGQEPYIVSVRLALSELDARNAPEPKEAVRAAAGTGVADVRVEDTDGLRMALTQAGPGTTIRVAAGTYEGGISARGLRGEPGRPIVLRAADPAQRPVIRGGPFGLHLSGVSHIEVHDLIVEGASGNGVNVDDGGSPDTPAHHVLLRRLVVRDVGPTGNRDGIKLSGVDDYRVEGCLVERWGDRGSGLDMVGCHRGEVAGCTFRHGDRVGDNGVQAKGGSAEITIRQCRFEHAGQRAVNLGGSTGLAHFRPEPRGYEARSITVEDCTFLGSMAPVAFVGVDGAVVRHNTIYRPKRWGLRVLQENQAEGFVPCREGRFTDNLIAFRSDEMAAAINVGAGTAPETFTLARNAWYCLDHPDRSRPKLDIAEANGHYGGDPRFRDAEAGDLRTRPDGPGPGAGARTEVVGSEEERP